MAYSTTAKKQINSTQAKELPLYLLEITHPQLTTPVRVVADNQDITVEGNVYSACAFRITLPDDLSNGAPRARLAVDNVDKQLVQWIEASGGGKDATVRILQVMRSTSTVIEVDLTVRMSGTRMTAAQVTAELGAVDLFVRQADVFCRPVHQKIPGVVF